MKHHVFKTGLKSIKRYRKKGVKLTKKAREKIEEKIERLTESTNQDFPDLGQWFIDIYYDKT
jgi:Zn-dependent oligopeptidase